MDVGALEPQFRTHTTGARCRGPRPGGRDHRHRDGQGRQVTGDLLMGIAVLTAARICRIRVAGRLRTCLRRRDVLGTQVCGHCHLLKQQAQKGNPSDPAAALRGHASTVWSIGAARLRGTNRAYYWSDSRILSPARTDPSTRCTRTSSPSTEVTRTVPTRTRG